MGLRRTLNMIRNIENWTAYLKYKYDGRKEDQFIFKVRNGFPVSVPRKIIPEFKESLFNEVYFKYLPEQIYSISKPVVVDIGANVGFFSILALLKLKNPRIISFEPIQRNFRFLEQNLRAAKNEKLSLVNKAVNDTDGELLLSFNTAQDITTSASLLDKQNGNGGAGETVTATTLEAIFSDYKLLKIDILKLDCEGAEYNIIYNTPARFFDQVNCITLETHQGSRVNENNATLAAYIRELGFTVKSKEDDFIWAYKDPAKWV